MSELRHVELRYVVNPKYAHLSTLQYRARLDDGWSEWTDVPTVYVNAIPLQLTVVART